MDVFPLNDHKFTHSLEKKFHSIQQLFSKESPKLKQKHYLGEKRPLRAESGQPCATFGARGLESRIKMARQQDQNRTGGFSSGIWTRIKQTNTVGSGSNGLQVDQDIWMTMSTSNAGMEMWFSRLTSDQNVESCRRHGRHGIRSLKFS